MLCFTFEFGGFTLWTMETKLQSFQYEILRKTLVTNTFLHLCKIKDTSDCHFCKNAPETIEHLFFDCEVIKNFWKDVTDLMPEQLELNKCCNRKAVLIGDIHNRHNELLNHILLLGKRYIYVKKCFSD